MPIYFNTNLMESRGLLSFDRINNKISTTLQRLETGYRINSAKDDPAGLVQREIMRADIMTTRTAINNTAQTDGLLTVAENSMGKLATLLNGDPTDGTGGLMSILQSSTMTAAQKKEQVTSLLDSMDKITSATIYNNKQVIAGAYDYKTSALQINGADAGDNVSDLRVTRAENVKGASQAVTATVTEVGKGAAFEIDNSTPITINQRDGADDGSLTIDVAINGKTYSSKQTNADDSATANYDFDLLVAAVNDGLAADNVTGYEASYEGGKFKIQATTVGKSTSVAMKAAAGTTGSGGSTAISVTNLVDASTGDLLDAEETSTGIDWGINAGAGTIASFNSDSGYIDVSSQDVAFSAKLSDTIAKGDEITFNVSGGASFQIAKSILDPNRLNTAIQDVRSANLGGATGKLSDLRTLNYNDDAELEKAMKITDEAINDLSSARTRIGNAQNTASIARENLEDQLTVTTNAETAISNTNVAEETSRLARYELIAESNVNAIQYARSFASFAVSSLLK